ncbi:MAG: hypothetical protein QMB52_10900 [Propionivibrio sp.]
MTSPLPLAELKFNRPPAVVVGACGHGLTLIRALATDNIPIIALDKDPDLPGTHTRLAHVFFVADINGSGLIEALADLGQRIVCPQKPVLFLTNDNMVRIVAGNWEKISDYFHLSWAHCRNDIASLLEKGNLEAYCLKQGVLYPPSHLIYSEADIDTAMALAGPVAIIKPSKPLANFKTALPKSRLDYEKLIRQYPSDLPFLVQKFIPGDDTSIHFCALYLDHGEIIARFDGRKLRSRPMGHTTIAESFREDEVFQQTKRFFAGLTLSGPVSVEFKRDANNDYWVIEPTVGRTDFWVGLCISNNINLPLTEYNNQLGAKPQLVEQTNSSVWFNEERDPFGRLWLHFQPTGKLGKRRAVYLFFCKEDQISAFYFIKRRILQFLSSIGPRSKKLLARLCSAIFK